MKQNNKRTNKKSRSKAPTYFTPYNGKSITIRYMIFLSNVEEMEIIQDIMNYRTRKFAENNNVEWFSETGLGDGSQASIYLYSEDQTDLINAGVDIVNFLKKYKNIKFLPDRIL